MGETKTSRGHVGTDGLDGMQFCAGHCCANSFLELVCPNLFLQLNTLKVFTPHLSFPKRPSPIFSSYFVVVNHSLSACIFYVGARFCTEGKSCKIAIGRTRNECYQGAATVTFCLLVSNPESVRELWKSMETPCSSHYFPLCLISVDGSHLIKAAKC